MEGDRRPSGDITPDEREVLEFIRAHRRPASLEMIGDCTCLSEGASVRGIMAELDRRGLVDVFRAITPAGRVALRGGA